MDGPPLLAGAHTGSPSHGGLRPRQRVHPDARRVQRRRPERHVKQEDFRRSEISEALHNRATTGGVNLEFGGGKVRLLTNYVSRKIGTPGTRKSQLITQA